MLALLKEAETPYEIETGTAAQKQQQRERMLRAFGKVLMYNYTPRLEDLSFNIREQPANYDTAVLKILLKPELREPVAALLQHLRKRVLIDNYNMQPRDILELVELFGPIDLRHPAAHGMYWGHLGIRAMTDTKSKDRIDYINTLRQRIHTMQDFTDSGRIFFDPNVSFDDPQRRPLVLSNDVRFIESYKKAVEFAESELSKAESPDNAPYKTGYENFLKKATLYWLFAGDKERSRQYYNEARERFGNEEHNKLSGYYNRSYEENVMDEMNELMQNMEEAGNFVTNVIGQALASLETGNMEESQVLLRWARRAHETYQKSMAGGTGLSPGQARMQLPPFDQIVNTTLVNNMLGIGIRRPLEFRIRMWRSLPLELKQRVFDFIKPRLYQEATDAGLDPARAFPEPENMAEYRKANPKELELIKPQENPLGPTKAPLSPLKP